MLSVKNSSKVATVGVVRGTSNVERPILNGCEMARRLGFYPGRVLAFSGRSSV